MEQSVDRFTALRRLDLQITGLVYAHEVREQAGATRHELELYEREIARQRRARTRLAVRPAGASVRRRLPDPAGACAGRAHGAGHPP
jgi:hypothetical protein